MLLPRGVTGFDSPAAGVTVPDLRCFRAECWQVAIHLHAKVEQTEALGYMSYTSQVLVWTESRVVVLLNKNCPILGLCKPFEPGTVAFDFLDDQKIANAFSEFGIYEMWSKNSLDLPLKSNMTMELGPSEKRRWSYFRKGTQMRVGDLVFNHWD